MYIFFPHKNYSIFHGNPTFTMYRAPIHNVSNSIRAIRKLGGKIYQVDQNSFARLTDLSIDEKIKFLESHHNS